MVPEHEDHWFGTYGRIALSRRAERFEHVAGALGRHYDVYAFPFGEPQDRRVGVFRPVRAAMSAGSVNRKEARRKVLRLQLAATFAIQVFRDAGIGVSRSPRSTRMAAVAQNTGPMAIRSRADGARPRGKIMSTIVM